MSPAKKKSANIHATTIPLVRGVVARCGQGWLGLITDGPTKLVINGEAKQLWKGIHLTDVANHKIGDSWQSFMPTPVCVLSEWLA